MAKENALRLVSWGDYKKRMHSETRFSAEEKRSQRLVMTLLVKNEEILLRGNLNFHLAQGVDHILVTDHGSTDATREILKEYEARGVVTVIEETSKAYHQKAFVTGWCGWRSKNMVRNG